MVPVLYPCVFHVRCNAAMLAEIKARGGGHWLRSLVTANSRPSPESIDESEPRGDERENVVSRLLMCDPIDDVESIRRQVAGWSMSQLKKATAWAQAKLYRASDNDDVVVPKMPDCVRTTQKGVSPSIAGDTPPSTVKRDTRRATGKRRVSLDKRKRRRVKSRPSRIT